MYQHDARHVDVLVKDPGSEHGNSVQTPAAHDVTKRNQASTDRKLRDVCSSVKTVQTQVRRLRGEVRPLGFRVSFFFRSFFHLIFYLFFVFFHFSPFVSFNCVSFHFFFCLRFFSFSNRSLLGVLMGIKEGTGNTQSVKRPGRSAGPESQKQSGIEKKSKK